MRTTTTRRPNGEPSYSQDPRTGNWKCRVTIDGRRISGTGTTRPAAKAAALAKVDHVQAGRRDGKAETVAAMLEAWMELEVEPNQTAAMLRNHSSIIRVWLVPHLGELPVHKVRPSDFSKVYKAAMRKGVRGDHIRAIRNTAGVAYRWAVEDGRVAGYGPGSQWNPARTSKLPKGAPGRASRTAPDRDAVEALLAVTDELHNGALWRLMAECALRPSEAAGLRWSDVDLAAGLIRVRGALRHDKLSGEWHHSPGVKNGEGGERDLPLTPEVVVLLHRQRAHVLELQMMSRWESDAWAAGLVFRKASDGRPMDKRHIGHFTDVYIRRGGGARFVPYQLRHYLPTRLAARGVPVSKVAALLGDDERTARRYYIDREEEAMDLDLIMEALA